MTAPPWTYSPLLPPPRDDEDVTHIQTPSVKSHQKVHGPRIDPATSAPPHSFPGSILPGREAPHYGLTVARGPDPGLKGVREERPSYDPPKKG